MTLADERRPAPPNYTSGVDDPRDWPVAGAIDARYHDLPKRSSGIEWWYTNAHVILDDGRPCSLFASFFRACTDIDAPADTRVHAATWALIDVNAGSYLTQCMLDRRVPNEILENAVELIPDPHIRRALSEVLERGEVPHPDRLFDDDPVVGDQVLDLRFGPCRFQAAGPDEYVLTLAHTDRATGVNLRLTFEKPVQRHGVDGVVRIANEEMFYYFVPRCSVSGSITIDGKHLEVRSGSGWYDHEFGNLVAEKTSSTSVTARARSTAKWTWFCAQLDSGEEFVGFEAVDTRRTDVPTRLLVHCDRHGRSRRSSNFTLETSEPWVSCSTFASYPTVFRVDCPELSIDVTLHAALADQEFKTMIAPPAFYEGRVEVAGIVERVAVTGLGFVEMSGHANRESHEQFLHAVGLETRRAVDRIFYSDDGGMRTTLIADAGHGAVLDGFDLEGYERNVINPLRDVLHRGGKAWRSYSLMAALEAVGGDPNQFRDWLAVPELVHTGSLIVDDVQDNSPLRRGGPSAHSVVGVPLAINAGCLSYFLAQLPVLSSTLSDAAKCRWYELYFETMRASHAGQAADIVGLSTHLDRLVSTGDSQALEHTILANHRLKSGLAPANVVRMAAHLASAPPSQVEALGQLFEAYGTAFQVIDDVLNLTGFEKGTKVPAEDILEGKITLPVARAFGLLDLADRTQLAALLLRATSSPALVTDAVEIIRACGALDQCSEMALLLVDDTWHAVEHHLEVTTAKVGLRAFGWFLLDRHY